MLVSVFSAAQVFAFDTSSVMTGDKSGKLGNLDWKFEESTGTLTISGSGASPDINGGDPWNGLDVKKVVVESGVTSIGDRLFSNLYNLTEATIADTVTEIKFCAFMNCSDLKSVKLPASLKTIESSAFEFCEKLDNVVIPNGCEEIKSSAFYADKSIKSIIIPDSVKSIEFAAFENTGLTTVTITNKSVTLGNYCFGYTYDGSYHKAVKGFKIYCDNDSTAKEYYDKLLSETPPETNVTWNFDSNTGTLTLSGTGETPWATDAYPAPWAAHYEDINYVIVNEGITVLNGIGDCPNLSSLRLADSVEIIKSNAFSCDEYNASLYDVEFGKGLKEIENGAFSGTNIRSLKLPDSLQKIGDSAFSGCSGLSSVTFGSGELKIGKYAFYETGLYSVEIPANVTDIDEYALGYYYDERISDDGEYTDYGDFIKNGFEIIAKKGTAAAEYADKCGIPLVTGAASINKTKASLKAGKTTKLKLENSGAIYWNSSNPDVAVADNNGKVYALKKGKATISPVTPRGLKFKCKVTVTSSPSIKIKNKKFNKNKLYTVKKGKKLTLKISGKAAIVNNSYKSANKKIAKVTSLLNAKTVKIKGYKKGKTTVTVKVNGVKFKIKVKVY